MEWWRRRHGGTGEGWWPRLRRGKVDDARGIRVQGSGTYQQIISINVGAIGQPTGFFVFEITPGGGVRSVGITAIGIVRGDVGGATADIRSQELSRTIVVLSAQLDDVLSETGILFLEFTDTVQRTHFVVGEANGCLEPSHSLFELGRGSANGNTGTRSVLPVQHRPFSWHDGGLGP